MSSKRKNDQEQDPTSSPSKQTSPDKTASAKRERRTKKPKTTTVPIEQPLVSIAKDLEIALAFERVKQLSTTTPAKSARQQEDVTMEENVASTSTLPTEPTAQPKKKKNKGKGKEKEVPESEISESEEEVDIILQFEVLDMDRETVYGNKTAYELTTEFTNPPPLYFGDHMAPFRGLMGDMKDDSAADKGKAVTKYIGKNFTRKVLVATTGKQTKSIQNKRLN